jgi:uncharacterized protein YdeI (YjbR/CyaY-like superfamily)
MTEPPLNSIQPLNLEEWRAWLEQNQARNQGVWLISYKKASGKARLEYEEIVEEALCFGWIDSKPNKLDEERSMLWISPRKPGANWSKLNKQRVEKLIREERMAAAGLIKIEASRLDGSWNALDSVEALEIPPDLEAAFATFESARPNFEAFPRSAKRAILEWILNAKQASTRAARVEETARLAHQNIRANQWRS